jgi:hypothetical protein
MTPAMRDALQDLVRPAEEQREIDDAIARKRERLEAAGLLGVVAAVALEHGLALDELLAKPRWGRGESNRQLVNARRAAWAAIRAERQWSFERIARVWDTRAGTVSAGIHDHQMKGGRRAA